MKSNTGSIRTKEIKMRYKFGCGYRVQYFNIIFSLSNKTDNDLEVLSGTLPQKLL